MAPSPMGLQHLINICANDGLENDILFNRSKYVCMVVEPSDRKNSTHLMYLNAAELNERVTHPFGRQFSDPRIIELPAFTGEPSPLAMPITQVKVQRTISKLNSGRACGHNDLPADLMKSTADLIAPSIATIFNDVLEHHEPLDIGKGVLILLQKPGKPVGPLTSVRPIVLLSALRKTLSLIVLSRIATKVDNFLSPSQSWFRRGRSTADVVFGYRWLFAKAQRQRITIEFLCID